MTYRVLPVTYHYPAPFKSRTMYRLYINGVKQHVAFDTVKQAKHAVKVLQKRWPGAVEIVY